MKQKFRLGPCTIKQAKRWVAKVHRHNIPSITAVFCVGLYRDDVMVGAAMVGLPKSRMLMDGATLEVTRVAVEEGTKNANSMLYGACARAAAALGYRRLVTYTLATESGSSLLAAGWLRDAQLRSHDVDRWKSHGGKGATYVDLFGEVIQRIPSGPKVRWFKELEQRSS